MRGEGRRRRTCATPAPGACRGTPRREEGGGRRQKQRPDLIFEGGAADSALDSFALSSFRLERRAGAVPCRDYDGRMALRLLSGPANAGKVALLLERYLAELDREPVLIVPNRSDVERVERELLRAAGCLLAGSIGTFDDLFERIARQGRRWRRPISELQRTLLVRRLVDRDGNGDGPRPPAAGLADSVSAAIAELGAGLAEPDHADGELARLYAGYRAELDRLGVWDRELERRYGAERVAAELEAWDGRPVFAYGFEDLTGAQWALLEALAGRADVIVSLPYEPGRAAFAALGRIAADLAGLAGTRVEELPARAEEFVHPALAHLERQLFGLDGFDQTEDGRPPRLR